MMEVCVSVQLAFYFSLKSAVKPMPRRLGSGGLISSRMVLRIPVMA